MYETLGAELAFLLYGLTIGLAALPFFCVKVTESVYETDESRLNATTLLEHAPILANIGALTVFAFASDGFDVLLALRLDEINYGTTAASIIYFFLCATYLLSAVIPSHLPQTIPRYYLVCAGLLGGAIGCAMIGPVPPLPTSVWIIGLGGIFMGLGYAFVYVPLFPMILRYCVDEAKMVNESQISDVVSSMIAQSTAIGMLTGPPVAGFVAELTSNSSYFNILAIMLLIVCPVYVFCFRRSKAPPTYIALTTDKEVELQ
mmetsp:Transcript_29986/g.53200  ORF Transcript_29986/g.53200 Transcript_29986/m.53200 type:complete len:260 (+) Transcript_29986:516-1295(+)